LLIDTDKPNKPYRVSEFAEHEIDFDCFPPANDGEIATFSYPFDTDAVSHWREWVQRVGQVSHGMDPDFLLPFLGTEKTSKNALLVMQLQNSRCELAVVVVPDTSFPWPRQSWRMFTHQHIDVYGFLEEGAGQTYDRVFDLVKEGLSNEGIKLSRLSFLNMQGLQSGERKFSEKFTRFNAFFDLFGPAAYTVPGKLNRNIKRYAKKIADSCGPLTLKVEPSGPDNMKTFFDVEASGWKDRENTAIRTDECLRRAYLAAAQDDDSNCRAHVFTLWAGRDPVSSAYGLVYANHISLLKIGFDERFARYSPGSLLISEVFQYARAAGVARIFFSTYPDWAKRWKPALSKKMEVHIFSNDRIGRYRYLFDRFITNAKQFIKGNSGLDRS
jgi:hypothetical protein